MLLKKNEQMEAIIKTNKGDMKVSLYTEDAPNTVSNFVKLIKDGYYDGLKWHRVIPDFVIQGGCPNSKDGASGMPGTGGPGYQIDCEIDGETNTMIEGYFPWHMLEGIPVVHNSSFAIAVIIQHILTAIILASVKLLKALRLLMR